jgi:Xaa-Pro aminopeptidase
MIVSNEPGYYKPGHYGMRFENLMVVQIADDLPESDQDILCFETLSLAPIDRALLERTLLTEEEAGWVDAYHCRVKELIGPWLSDTDTNWLNEATRPLSA